MQTYVVERQKQNVGYIAAAEAGFSVGKLTEHVEIVFLEKKEHHKVLRGMCASGKIASTICVVKLSNKRYTRTADVNATDV